MPTKSIRHFAVCALLAAVGLGACSGAEIEEPEPYITEQKDRIRERAGTIHGNPDGITLFGGRSDASETAAPAEGAPSPALGGLATVNPYLWQASLESLDFMPLAQADSRGGVIISDWYAPPETPSERFKVTVYILDRALRADALKVAVFRQLDGDKGWVDAAVDKATASGLEDNILKRARELRLASDAAG